MLINALPVPRVLDISFNLLRNIEGIDKLTRLKKLFLVNNKINKIENISSLHQLQMLELGSNRIRVGVGTGRGLQLGSNRIWVGVGTGRGLQLCLSRDRVLTRGRC